MDASLTVNQDLMVVCTPTDDTDAPAPLEAGTFKVTSQQPTIISHGSIEKDGEVVNGLPTYIARCTPLMVGQATLSVDADGDVGEGVAALHDEVNVLVTSHNAAKFGLQVTIVPKGSPLP